MSSATDFWKRFDRYLVRYPDLEFWLDASRMNFSDGFLSEMQPAVEKALAEMKNLEAGAIANPDEDRMVGHYWLRAPEMAPSEELQNFIREGIADAKAFAEEVHSGDCQAANGNAFRNILLVGIGGSALGPQLVAAALQPDVTPIHAYYFDNTDPGGMDSVLREIGDGLAETLTIVVSKSGGTKETRNGMLEAARAYEALGLNFAQHAVAVTGPGSQLDKLAESEGWLRHFPMADWIGGRTSVMSSVGLIPAALLGIDIQSFLAGAAAMDNKTRATAVSENAAMMLALMWYHAGNGKGEKDMVVLPYCDHLLLFSKYLQQLVMESLGKELDRDGKVVNQGIAVYGNKGSTDQHAYVQQLRDGVNNFFATFVEVRSTRSGASMEVDPGVTTGDYLQGFLRGTRSALAENARESVTLSIPRLDAFTLGLLIGLFERAVSFYATLVNINAYHQPGVEAGKKAAGEFLKVLTAVREYLEANPGKALTADEVASAAEVEPESAYHALSHLEATRKSVTKEWGESATADTFTLQA